MKYWNVQGDNPVVTLPQNISSVGIERILKECYHKSLLKKYDRISFDFNSVIWCDVFSLSLVSLWLWELTQHSKTLTVALPPLSSDVRRFFDGYGFTQFLIDQHITVVTAQQGSLPPRSRGLFIAPFYPLTFMTEPKFHDLLHDLHQGDRLQKVLAEVSDANVVKSGAIRDVVLKELGDNALFHGDGKAAHFVMTKLSSRYSSARRKDRRRRAKELADLEDAFLRKVGEAPILEIVISDKGPGISCRLGSTYPINGDAEAPSECAVIEYAFEYGSSSRSLEERIRGIKRVITSASLKVPPPSGLHRLKEVVRDNRGFLYVRSGSSVICYDFYLNQTQDKATWSDDLSDGKRLAKFGGVQFMVLLPVLDSPSKTRPGYLPAVFTEDPVPKEVVERIAIRDYFDAGATSDPDNEAAQLRSFFAEIDDIRRANKGRHLVLLVDFSMEYAISSKARHYLICDLMQRQEALETNVAIFVPGGLIADLRLAFTDAGASFGKPLLSFDESFSPHLLGTSGNNNAAFHETARGNADLSQPAIDFASANPHIFHYSKHHNRYMLSLSSERTMQLARSTLKKQLAKAILDPANGVYDPDIKVLLLSQAYSLGYFEIYKLMSSTHLKAGLTNMFSCTFIESQPDVVVSVGGQTGQIVEETIRLNAYLKEHHIEHINLRTGRRGYVQRSPLLRLDKCAKVVVVIDVIGTGRTLEFILGIILHTQILGVLAIVNGSTGSDDTIEVEGRRIQIEYIVRKQLVYHEDLPRDWLYSEVHQVDPDTHVLVRTTAKTEGALWKDVGCIQEQGDRGETERLVNRFLDDVVLPVSAFLEGHFESGRKHIRYLFDIRRIAEQFSEEFLRTIGNDVKSVIEKRKTCETIKHIVYPEFNPGVHIMARICFRAFPRGHVVAHWRGGVPLSF